MQVVAVDCATLAARIVQMAAQSVNEFRGLRGLEARRGVVRRNSGVLAALQIRNAPKTT
jgi:hypothetical protein